MKLLTPQQAADALSISLGAFYALRRRHPDRYPNRGKGRSLRFYESDLVRTEAPVSLEDFRARGAQLVAGVRR